MRDLTRRDGIRLEDAVRAHGVELDRASASQRRLRDVRAYLELHIEQGPVLEGLGLAVGTVLGTVGVERNRVIFRGQAAHAGSTPMTHRRDSFLAAARFALAVRDAAIRHGGMSTTGKADSKPGVVTAIAGETALLLDQRHLDADVLAALLAESRDARRGGRDRREVQRRVGAALADRADPVRRRPDRRRAPRLPGGRRAPTTRCPPARCTTPPRWRATCRP